MSKKKVATPKRTCAPAPSPKAPSPKKGKKIRSLDEILDLKKKKKAIMVYEGKTFVMTRPAAFLARWSLTRLASLNLYNTKS